MSKQVSFLNNDKFLYLAFCAMLFCLSIFPMSTWTEIISWDAQTDQIGDAYDNSQDEGRTNEEEEGSPQNSEKTKKATEGKTTKSEGRALKDENPESALAKQKAANRNRTTTAGAKYTQNKPQTEPKSEQDSNTEGEMPQDNGLPSWGPELFLLLLRFSLLGLLLQAAYAFLVDYSSLKSIKKLEYRIRQIEESLRQKNRETSPTTQTGSDPEKGLGYGSGGYTRRFASRSAWSELSKPSASQPEKNIIGYCKRIETPSHRIAREKIQRDPRGAYYEIFEFSGKYHLTLIRGKEKELLTAKKAMIEPFCEILGTPTGTSHLQVLKPGLLERKTDGSYYLIKSIRIKLS